MHHPDPSLLNAYASGEISAVDGLAIATHLESCTHCQDIIHEYETTHAEQFERSLNEASSIADYSDLLQSNSDLQQMFSVITQQPMAIKPMAKRSQFESGLTDKNSVSVNGKTFLLPLPLQGVSHRIGAWRSYGNKVFSAVIDLGEDQRVNLLYMSDNVQVPQHTHKGFESTLVLHGQFSDENGDYTVGDFVQTDHNVEHAPRTHQGQDCLCLTTLTEPMMFTQGVARMFNLFGRGMYP